MKYKSVCLVLMLLSISRQSNSATQAEKGLEKDINKAVLIIKGKLIDKFSKVENIKSFFINRDKEVKESSVKNGIYTTFVFQVEDVMKGNYSEDTIKVIMKGGCSLERGACVYSSWGYDFSINETGVLFLNYRYKTDLFQSSGASSTAFAIDSEGLLQSKAYSNVSSSNKNQIKFDKNSKPELDTGLSISTLISVINKLEIKQ